MFVFGAMQSLLTLLQSLSLSLCFFSVQNMPSSSFFAMLFAMYTIFLPLLRMIPMISILDHALQHPHHHMENTNARIHSNDTHIQWIASVYVFLRRNQLFKLCQSCEKLAPSFSRKYNQTDCGKCISFHLRLKCWLFFSLENVAQLVIDGCCFSLSSASHFYL